MRKLLHTLFTLTLVLFFFQAKAQVTLSPVDPGPYTPGSTIAATFTLGPDCIPTTNTFELYLSDAAGNFVSTTPIGTYPGFYSTYVNGLIPLETPAGIGYKVRIRSTSSGLFSAASLPFVITAGAAAEAKLTSATSTIATNPNVIFGNCNTDPNIPNTTFRFTNASTAADVTVTIVNELIPGAPAILTFISVGQALNYSASLAHFTMVVRAVMPDGTVSTKAYFLVNNLLRLAFTTTSANTVCYPTGTFQYLVNITTADGIGRNFPGNTYHIDWGDGRFNDYTYCDIVANSNTVSHSFTQSSCGLSYSSGNQTTYNAFGVNVNTISPFCGPSGSPLSTPARVASRPENKFTFPSVACLGNVTFVNASLPGQKASTNSIGCAQNNVFYTWYVDGVMVPGAQDQPLSYNMQFNFTTTGPHIIRLTSTSDGSCQADDLELPICIQNPPQPSFTLPATNLCLSAPTLTPTNTSVLDNTCPNVNPPVYTWTVNPSVGVTFTGGTNQNSTTPTFSFSQIGVYNIALNVQSATCQAITPIQEVVVNTVPQATLSADAQLCTKGATFTFGPAASPTQTTISGTAKTLADTYTWSVTGANTYTFASPDGPNTQYPTIIFSDYGTYNVTLTHQNNCGTVTKTQVITFSPSPVPLITVNPTACYNTPVNLTGTITNGTYTSFAWSSSGGGTFSDPASLTPSYTPSAADLAALSTTITLTVNTGIPGSCAVVRDIKTITIFPNNTGTNATQTICTGNTTAYTPVSSVTGSTFIWTAANADGNATGFTPTGSGAINETITNNNTTANTIVVYTITPLANGCSGIPYTFTVTVTPRPLATATPASPVICSNKSASIALVSNLGATTQYTWTSAVTGTVTGNTSPTVPATLTAITDILVNTGTAQGSVTYTITPISATGCTGTPVTATVLVDPAVTIADAGPDESICNTTVYTLKGNPAVVGTGVWTLTSGQTGVLINPANAENTAVSGLQPGQTYTFRWTITAPGACDPTTDDVVITVNTPTAPGSTSTANPTLVCSGTNTGVITLTGNTGSVLNWQNSTNGGATWIDIANTTNTLTYTNITVSTQYRAVVKNGQCTTEFSTATPITVTPPTTIAQAGPDQTLCAETVVTLAGGPALQAGEAGIWTQTSGPATVTIVTPSDPNTIVRGLVPGQNYTFTWTINGNAPCGPTFDNVVITDHLPLTNTISSTSPEVCYNQVIAITGGTPTGGNGTYSYLWEVSTDGTNWNAIPGQTGRDLSYQLQATSSFRRTVTSGICPLVSNVIQIIAQPPITNNTIAAGQSICTGIVPDPLTGTTPAGSDGNFNYQWQFSEDNGATWTNVNGAVSLSYAPLALTTTTVYRRLVGTVACNGALQSISNVITIIVRPNAKAEYTFTADKGCTPFVIDASTIRAVAYPDRNASYTWYADNVQIGTGITFPGYTIAASDQSVTIKLITAPSQGCQPDEFNHVFSTNQSVTASYTQSAAQGCGPLIVNFVNTSTSLTNATFTWDFGNGVTSSQTMPAPVTFQPDPTGKDITYTVTLTATTSCGSTSTTSTVFVKAKPISVFSPSRTVGCSPMLVTFSNTSPGETNTYSYDFGDGTPLVTTTDKSSIQHTYLTNVVKDFVVTMTAQNECGSNQSSYTIRVAPNTVTAELVVNADQKAGCAPFTVNFYNNSRGANSFIYDFGDGSILVTRAAPEVVNHTFTTAGTYNVVLTASNGCSEITTTESITVLPQPLTAFSADNTLGCPGLVVQFRNTSTGGISYLWDFGDGTTSQEAAPQHVYAGTQEFYTVSLTATNSLGCTYTTTLNQYIHVVPPPVAQFNVLPSTLISIPNYTFKFEDESTNNPTIWLWDFGDKQTSILKNPSHTYLDTGTYTVTLRVANQQGCFTTTFKKVTIAGVPGYLFVPNSFMPGSTTPELRVFGAKGSGIKTWTMSIFNKWGQQLWQTSRLNEGRPDESWDGTFNSFPVPQGVYFWKIEVEFINGTAWKGMTYDSSAPKKTGVIHLLR